MNKDKEMNRITKKYKAGKLEPREDLPEDLKIAIKTFMEQVMIMEEYNTDYINVIIYLHTHYIHIHTTI